MNLLMIAASYFSRVSCWPLLTPESFDPKVGLGSFSKLELNSGGFNIGRAIYSIESKPKARGATNYFARVILLSGARGDGNRSQVVPTVRFATLNSEMHRRLICARIQYREAHSIGSWCQ